ncbi:MAG: hypothetical protein ACI4LM_03215 [Anaerovoracaceae bacterium]
MNIQSLALLAVIIAAFAAAAVWSYRHRGSCGCAGSRCGTDSGRYGCGKGSSSSGASCGGNCASCPFSMFENTGR